MIGLARPLCRLCRWLTHPPQHAPAGFSYRPYGATASCRLIPWFAVQAVQFGSVIATESVVSLNLTSAPFELRTRRGLHLYARSIIVAECPLNLFTAPLPALPCPPPSRPPPPTSTLPSLLLLDELQPTHSAGLNKCKLRQCTSRPPQTGASERWLDAPGEHRLRGQFIHSCALCDGQLYKDQVLPLCLRLSFHHCCLRP